MIKAKGKLYGEIIEIICDNNLKLDYEFLQAKFNYLLSERYPVGGTIFPEEKSMINAYNVLQNHFFDELISIEGDFDERLPCEDGIIY